MNSTYTSQTYPIIVNNKLVTDPTEKANCLLKEFVSSSKLQRIQEPEDLIEGRENAKNSLNNEEYNTEINMTELEKIIAILKNTAPGLHGISNTLLKNIPYNVKIYWIQIINQSYIAGVIPSE